MSDERPDAVFAFLVGQFKRAAMVTHFGYLDEDIPTQRAGIRNLAMPERALAVLTEISERRPTRAYMTAFWIVERYEHGELEM